MGFTQSIRVCLGKYATFSGRARRSEFWWFFLFIMLGQTLFSVVDRIVFGEELTAGFTRFFQLSTLLPLAAVSWRRLHDIGLPGWLNVAHLPFLILAAVFTSAAAKTAALLIMVGISLFLIFLMTKRGGAGANRFGPEPS